MQQRSVYTSTVQSVRVAISVPKLSGKYVEHGYRFSVLKNQGNHKKMDNIQEQQKRTDKVTIRDDYCLW